MKSIASTLTEPLTPSRDQQDRTRNRNSPPTGSPSPSGPIVREQSKRGSLAPMVQDQGSSRTHRERRNVHRRGRRTGNDSLSTPLTARGLLRSGRSLKPEAPHNN